jgi:hypothetical protein
VEEISRNHNSVKNLSKMAAAPTKISVSLHMDSTNSKTTSYKTASIKLKNVDASCMKAFASMAIAAILYTRHPPWLMITVASRIYSSRKSSLRRGDRAYSKSSSDIVIFIELLLKKYLLANIPGENIIKVDIYSQNQSKVRTIKEF